MNDDTRTFVTIGAIGIGAYFVYKAIQELGDIKDKLNDAGAAIGSGLFDLFHPDQVGETIFYTPMFPDGQKHAVPSRSVNSKGQFRLTQFYGNTLWQLVTNKKDGKRYAAKV